MSNDIKKVIKHIKNDVCHDCENHCHLCELGVCQDVILEIGAFFLYCAEKENEEKE